MTNLLTAARARQTRTEDTAILYDAPGPVGRRRNSAITVGFALALAALAWWLLATLAGKGELAGIKWATFTRADVWTTYLLPGLAATLLAAALSLAIALPVGAALAVGRLSDRRWVRWPAAVVVEFFRAVPVLLMMVFAKQMFILGDVGSADLRPLLAVVAALVLYNGSVLAEVFRSGIHALPKGQTEAAQSIGLRKGQMMRMILFPQAFTAMLPAIVSQLVVIVKDTALGSQLTILYPELLASARTITANFSNVGAVVPTYVVIAVIFIVINYTLTTLARLLEAKLRRRGRRTAPLGATARDAGDAGLI